jgi:predicted metal-dependent hydrolase
MVSQIKLGDMAADVVLKDIKNVHLSVYPPTGLVRISAPEGMSIEAIRLFAISKLDWIKQQQKKQREQARESPREYLDRESHYVWGRRYLMKVVELDAPASIDLAHGTLVLRVRPGSDAATRRAVVSGWYREVLKTTVPPLIAAWEPRLGVSVHGYFVQQMKTKWGSCNSTARTIRLNTELAKKPTECLEYIVLHEMVHLRESTHNARFAAMMSQFMPDWQIRKQTLNRLPIGHPAWAY